jgi:predicted TIM-barrel fold metal-dependent hydrolase
MLGAAIEELGADRVMFETDFPHPTCLYPDSAKRVNEAIRGLDPEVRRKILRDNAADLYGIAV